MPLTLSKLVLDQEVTRHEFRRVASVLGWTIRGFGSDVPDEPFEEAWGTPGQRTEVHFVEDPYVGLSYLLVPADDRETVAAQISERLHIWTPAEAARVLAEDSPELRAEAVRILAVSASEAEDPPVLAALRTAAGDEAEEVRLAVVLAAGYLPEWPGVRSLLAQLAGADPSASVRADAQVMLDTIESDVAG